MSDYRKTLHHRFPRLSSRLSSLPDSRKRKTYSLPEILTGGLSMFLLKEAKLVTANGLYLYENAFQCCVQNGW
jgi:hypothetical protein